MKKNVFLTVVVTAIFALSFTPYPVSAETSNTPALSKNRATPQPAAQKANTITQAALKNGVRTCAGRINQVTNFLTAGAKGGGFIMIYPTSRPDRHMTSVSMEIPLQNNTAYASASFAPGQENYCEGLYETVVYWPQTCSEVAEKQFGKFKRTGALSRHIYVRDGGATKVFLMPAGAGCVSIKKELIR
ncbi:MAG TPA: hypothetical protein PK004_06230 [Smithella sp.]|nr:hypothetical protein [Smithellaceae bacterium]HPX30664.1 hypothetical protein [Smithella sp.]HQP41031.1 hypothetical protein [Smithella sp.]